MSTIRFEIRDDPQQAAVAAARHVAAAAREAIAARGAFHVAFSGGRTPAVMLAELSTQSLPWHAVQVYQVDERIAPAGDAARNLAMLHDALLSSGLLPPGNLHPMRVEQADLPGAARRYAGKLRSLAGTPAVLDLVHLGLGDDGHTASLVPGDAVLAQDREDVAITGDYRGHRRMTLTFPALDRARERLWLATGADKAGMLARLRIADAAIPAGRVRADASVVYCDAPAAARLPR